MPKECYFVELKYLAIPLQYRQTKASLWHQRVWLNTNMGLHRINHKRCGEPPICDTIHIPHSPTMQENSMVTPTNASTQQKDPSPGPQQPNHPRRVRQNIKCRLLHAFPVDLNQMWSPKLSSGHREKVGFIQMHWFVTEPKDNQNPTHDRNPMNHMVNVLRIGVYGLFIVFSHT